MNHELYAVVPVRQGSRRLKNKNVAPFAGTNLLLHKIEQLKKVPQIDKIIVSSDSDEMLAMAKLNGATPHKRTIEYCDEHSKSFGEVVAHICSAMDAQHILWATCTAPLVMPKLYSSAIEKYYECIQQKEYDSLASVEVFKRYLWDQHGPVNYALGTKHVPSQQLPVYHLITDGILLAPREDMIKWNYFHGPNPYRFVLDKRSAIDIDDGLDLAAARAWLDMDESVSQIDPFQI